MGDFYRWNAVLLYNPMRDYGGYLPVEEIQNAIVPSLKTCPQFVNFIFKQIGFGPSQFMPFLPQPFDFPDAFQSSL